MLTEEHGDAQCGICFELLVEPTTLVCGHTFCRHCLAQWTVSSGKRLCPNCKVEWRGSPKVNILIRNMLENAYSQKLAQRIREVKTDENRRLIAMFDTMTSDAARREIMLMLQNGVQAGRGTLEQNNDARCKYFSTGIAIGVLVICILAYIRNLGQRNLIDTPVKEWNTDDVIQWMGQLGSWAERYSDTIRNNGIDGRMLLVMKESDVIHTLHLTDELQRRVFLSEIAVLASTGNKPPKDLWEYKSKYPFFTLVMFFGFKLCPRVTIAYLYLFEYTTVYLPFMNYACPEFTNQGMTHATAFSRVATTICLPYWLFGRYALAWSSTHYFVSRYIVLICVLATVYDVMWYLPIFMRKWTLKDVHAHVVVYLRVLLLILLSTIMPWFVYNFYFYDHLLSLVLLYPTSIHTIWKRLTTVTVPIL
ncbi:bifunctional apoptosis regulator-like [Argopecten irradians]|uniref:bifunctional apoptosis regulator-like n=1 Tax=Argopecten irradians TaxID=31199 RepID=UPI0037243DA0